MIECNVEFAGLEIRRVRSGRRRIDLEVLWLILRDKVQQGAPKIRQETVVLFLNGISENVVFLKEMTVINVEGSQLIFAHGVDLFNIDQFAVGNLREISIGCRSRCQSNFFGEPESGQLE